MLPGIGGGEIVVIGVVALLVVGPKDLPKLLRQLGRFVGRMRAMADDFKSSFEDMARQSELDDLRKEVEALRTSQSLPGLGDVKAEMTSIESDIHQSLTATPVQPVTTTSLERPARPMDPALADPQMEGLPPRGAPDEVISHETKQPLLRANSHVSSDSSDETAPAKPKRKSRAKKPVETTDTAS